MKGVVFQISDMMITAIADQRCENQAKSVMPNHWLTNPDWRSKAYFQASADTTVTMPYGSRIEVRRVRRAKRALCMTMAKANPMTSSTATVMSVITNVLA